MDYSSNNYLVRYADLEYARAAFVDARTPGSHLKENYCIIGKGVSENPRQPIHIKETDGFHVGAAGQPPGILNSLHSHFTAEVFLIFKGQFRIYWGPDGARETILGPGDMISVPTNCFRGFEVVGDDNGFLFTLLGGDDCGGGIVWHPSAIVEGRKHGMYLLKSKKLADTVAGDPVPSDDELFPVMTDDEVNSFDDYSEGEMLNFVSRWSAKRSRSTSFSQNGDFSLYHISGHPDNPADFEVKTIDGACIYAYGMSPGGIVPMHRRSENQVLVNLFGDVRIDFEDTQLMPIVLTPGDTYDMPKGTAYSLQGVRGESYTYCFVDGDFPAEPVLI